MSRPWLRMIGLLVFVGVPGALLTLGTITLLHAFTLQDEIELQSVMLTRLETRGQLAEQGGERIGVERIFVRGDTPSVALAALRQRVIDLMTASGGTLIETRGVEVADTAGSADQVALSTSFEVATKGLEEIIRTLETGLPLLIVDGLTVRKADRADMPEDDPLLLVDLTVRGNWQGQAQ